MSIDNHKDKCMAKNKFKRKKITNSTKSKRLSKEWPNADNSYNNEIKESRRLDGSRDYWQIRDRGKFGSHSSYDDMGDESFS